MILSLSFLPTSTLPFEPIIRWSSLIPISERADFAIAPPIIFIISSALFVPAAPSESKRITDSIAALLKLGTEENIILGVAGVPDTLMVIR